MSFQEDCALAAGKMLSDPHETGFTVNLPDPGMFPGEGMLTLFSAQKGGEEHASLELHGLSREQTVRVLRVLGMGRYVDHYLERALAEAAGY